MPPFRFSRAQTIFFTHRPSVRLSDKCGTADANLQFRKRENGATAKTYGQNYEFANSEAFKYFISY